ncbi:hypothetical protein NC652_000062 [Populus alba x Populus x berolinensis]|nr:hypothetical protein NC652_000062 [Populus alba x Populus x berolinensis]
MATRSKKAHQHRPPLNKTFLFSPLSFSHQNTIALHPQREREFPIHVHSLKVLVLDCKNGFLISGVAIIELELVSLDACFAMIVESVNVRIVDRRVPSVHDIGAF